LLPELRRGSRGPVLIAIDGPAGSGKSSVARMVAARLGYRYLDSGAMYRAVALRWLAHPQCEPPALARGAAIGLEGEHVLLDGSDVSGQIRAPGISEAASQLSAGWPRRRERSCWTRARSRSSRSWSGCSSSRGAAALNEALSRRRVPARS